jgi:predicted amidohydrolase
MRLKLRIGLVQMICEKGALERNLALTLAYIEEAARQEVDIVAFPEASLTGYAAPTAFPHAALGLESPTVRCLIDGTRGTSLTVLAGIVEANPDPASKPYLTHLVIRDGVLVGTYRKMTLSDDEDWHEIGDRVPVFTHNGVTFGIAICADITNKDVFTQAARQGAVLVFELAAPGLYGEQATRNWRSGFEWWRGECDQHLSEHARDHGLWIAVATQAGRTIDEDFPGGAYLFAPDGSKRFETPNWSPGAIYVEIVDVEGLAVGN